jgi:predicted DNA-binding transcriptional regulator AlpA
MSTDITGSGTGSITAIPKSDVSLSKWVNKKLPAWNELLSAHEVARLTGRHRWVLLTLTLLGGFPKPQRYEGRRVGWKRREVEQWIAEACDESASATALDAAASSTPAMGVRARSGAQRRCGQAGALAECRTRTGAKPRRKTRRVARARRPAATGQIPTRRRPLEP